MASLAFVLASALIVCGCVSTDSLATGEAEYPPRPGDHPIELLKTAKAAPAGSQVIGFVDAVGGWWNSEAAVREAVQEGARELGGDAAVYVSGSRVVGYFLVFIPVSGPIARGYVVRFGAH